MTVRVRIAPSPTGDPHVGTGYVALFNYIWAKKHGGQFILRIEDTDQTRSTPESEAAILRSLRWLGLEWDEGPDIGGDYGPYRQSERTDLYREHVELLIERDWAYRCFATSEELAELRKHQLANKLHTRYDGRWRDRPAEEIDAQLAAGTPYTVRLKFPREGQTVVSDGLRGEITFENTQIDDQILLKSDGFPTYHLANVVDDHAMGITDVIRAEEWISSTPKHLCLYEAFGWEPPKFWHLPLLRNTDRSKISKRKNPVSLDYYERIGIFPEALRNFLGLLGWSMPDESEVFTVEQMVEAFTFERVGLAGPVFDLQKLNWLNGQYLRAMSPEDLVQRLLKTYLTPERLLEIMPLVHERINRLDGFVPMTSYMLGGGELAIEWQSLVPKRKFSGTPDDVRKALLRAAEVLDSHRPWTAEALEEALRGLATDMEWKAGHLFAPIRTAITARTATPPLFETMVAIGGPLVRARIRQAAALLKGKTLEST